MMLAEFVGNHCPRSAWYSWAWEHYKDTIIALSEQCGGRDWLEIGGGRRPLFDQSEIHQLGIHYTVNDISDHELNFTPDWVERAVFDISHEVPTQQYNLIFSRSVFEHIARPEAAYRNLYKLLRAGGIALNFYPTLYGVPFIINHLLPHGLSQYVQRWGQRWTDAPKYPHHKFPAYYRWCRSTQAIVHKLQTIGFEVVIVPFYGHGYFRRIPGLRLLDDEWSRLAQRYDWRLLSSYAYGFLRKPEES